MGQGAAWMTENLWSSSEISELGVVFPPLFTAIPLGDTERSGDAAKLNSTAEFTLEKWELLLFVGEKINLLLSHPCYPYSLWLGKWEKIDSEGWVTWREVRSWLSVGLISWTLLSFVHLLMCQWNWISVAKMWFEWISYINSQLPAQGWFLSKASSSIPALAVSLVVAPLSQAGCLQRAACVLCPRTVQKPWKMLFRWQRFGVALENNFLLVDSTKLFPFTRSLPSPKQKERWKDSLGIIHSALPPVWDLAVCVHPPAQGRSEGISLGRICCWLNCTLSLSCWITNAVASLALASEKARSSACGLEGRGENRRRAVWKTSSCGEDMGQTQAVWHSGLLLRDAEQVCSCSGSLCYLLGGGGTQQELVKAAPVLFSGKCGMLVTQRDFNET